ncbi:carboxypeptidase-like regulatory domain-containing protein [Ancylomarina sp. YFZ004]
MKKYSLQLLICLLLIPFSGYSQGKLKARISSSNNEAVPYASVVVKGTSLGTISNANGDFELALPDDKAKQQIAISCIGYKTQEFSIDSLRKVQKVGKVLRLLLPKQAYQLQEILVGKQEILKDAKQIFVNAIHELPNLLDDQPHIGKYYFRQTHRDDSIMNRLIEAAVSIYDPGIGHEIKACKMNIDELQSSLDNRDIDYKTLLGVYRLILRRKNIDKDTILTNDNSHTDPVVQKHLINAFDNNKASFSKFFTCTNLIRSAQGKKRRKGSKKVNPWFVNGGPLISKTFMKKHRFKLDTIIQYNGEPIYKIKILPNKNYPGLEGQKDAFIPIGLAYIRIKDYALLNLDYGYINNHKYKGSKYRGERHGGFKGKFHYHYRFKIRFKEYNSKFHLSYLYSRRGDYNSNLSGHRQLIQEMVNTEIINEQDSVSKQLNTLNWKGDHYEKLPYNKEFWDNYSIMLPTLEQENLKKNLEQEILKK